MQVWKQVFAQRGIGREVKKATLRLKRGKAAGVDGICLEMLKYDGNAEVKCMF